MYGLIISFEKAAVEPGAHHVELHLATNLSARLEQAMARQALSTRLAIFGRSLRHHHTRTTSLTLIDESFSHFCCAAEIRVDTLQLDNVFESDLVPFPLDTALMHPNILKIMRLQSSVLLKILVLFCNLSVFASDFSGIVQHMSVGRNPVGRESPDEQAFARVADGTLVVMA